MTYWQTISTVLPENLVFLDEMGVLQGIARPRGRSRKGRRVYDIKPFYRGRRVTVVGAISQTAILAMRTLGKSMKGEDFKQFVAQHSASVRTAQGSGLPGTHTVSSLQGAVRV